jgi:hypothetical protein
MSAILRYTLETAVCLTLFYAGYWLFLRRETCFGLNRIYLVSSLFLSLLIPLFKVPSPLRTVPVPAGPLELPPPAALPARTLGLGDILLFLYAVGGLLFLARLVRQMVLLRGLVRSSETHVLDGLKLVSVAEDFAPFSFFDYVFLNERSFDPGNLRHVLAHERAHINQRHSLDVLLVEGVTVLQWFNPIVRPYKRAIQETHEFLADGEVIAQGFNPARYQLLMLEQEVGSRLVEVSSDFHQSQFKRRIVMMSRMRSKGTAKFKVLLLIPLAALLVLALARPRPVPAAERALVPNPQEKVTTSPDETKRQKLIAEAESILSALKDKEAKLDQLLESTADPAKREELKASLEKVRTKRKNVEAFLKEPDNVPPPPPLPPPAPEGKAGLKKLQAKETEIREALESTADPEKQKELKAWLKEVLKKRADLEARLEAQGESVPPPPAQPLPPGSPAPAALASPSAQPAPPAPAESDLQMLKDKEADLRSQLAVEKDPDKIRELEHDLQVVIVKQKKPEAHLIYAKDHPVPPPPPKEPAPATSPEVAAAPEPSTAPTASAAPALAPLPPPPPPPDIKEMLRRLDKKQQSIRQKMDRTDDPAEKDALEKDLQKLEQRRAEIKAKFKVTSPAERKMTAADLQKAYAELEAKEETVKAELKDSTDDQQTARLEELLKKIELKKAQVKAELETLKAAPAEKK